MERSEQGWVNGEKKIRANCELRGARNGRRSFENSDFHIPLPDFKDLSSALSNFRIPTSDFIYLVSGNLLLFRLS